MNTLIDFDIFNNTEPDVYVDTTSIVVWITEGQQQQQYDIANFENFSLSPLYNNQSVNVGYHALTANMSIANLLDKTKKTHTINIDTKNLNGEFVPAKGTIKVYKLLAPNSVLRQRPWAAPDYQDFTKETFKNLFRSSSSISIRTTVPPALLIAPGTGAKVKAVVITGSPGFKPAAFSAICSA